MPISKNTAIRSQITGGKVPGVGAFFEMRMKADLAILDRVANLLDGNDAKALGHVWDALSDSIKLLRQKIDKYTPRGASGDLSRSFKTAMVPEARPVSLGRPVSLHGEVFTDVTYAIPVEVGTRPHFPPLAPIREWVEKKLHLSGSQADRAAHAIRIAIGRRGTQGQKMFETGFKEAEIEIYELFNKAIDLIERDIYQA